MKTNIYEAKTQFSKLIQLIMSKEEESIIICKNGEPVAEIIPFQNKKNKRIGAAKGLWKSMSLEEINSIDVATMFDGEE